MSREEGEKSSTGCSVCDKGIPKKTTYIYKGPVRDGDQLQLALGSQKSGIVETRRRKKSSE